MPAQTADPLVSALRTLAQSSPDLRPAAQLYEIILPLLRDADLHAEPIVLGEVSARAKLPRGIPLLRDEPLLLDSSAFRDLLVRLARGLEKSRPAAKPIRTALEKNQIDLVPPLPGILSNDYAALDARAQALHLDAGLLRTLAQNAVKPAYRAWAQSFGSLPRETEWEHADCFVCGDLATLAELQGNDQFRHLRCGRCGADWESRRLMCVYCGNENPKTLGKLYADNQSQQMHAQVCDNCKGYLKVINAFSPNPPEMLAVQDLATLHLDFIAQRNGYSRLGVNKPPNQI